MLLITQSGYEKSHGQDDSALYEQRAEDRITVECGELVGPANLRCANEIRNAEAQAYLSQQDLKAQRESAQWGFWMTAVSGLSVLFTGIGIFLLRHTLHESIVANLASQEANAIMRQESRPWLDFTLVSGLLKYRESPRLEDSVAIELEIEVTNFGHSPAVNVYAICGVFISDKMLGGRWMYRKMVENLNPAKTSGSAVFPGSPNAKVEKWFREIDGIVEYPHERDSRPIVSWYLLVCVVYKSVGGDSHLTCKAYHANPPDEFYKYRAAIIGSPDADANGGVGGASNEVYA
jgi:hypothetical protein